MLKTVYAADAISPTVTRPQVTALEAGLPGLFNMAINVVLGAGIALTIIFLIIGGIQYITSRGDQKAADTARKSLTNAVIGFIVVVGAFSIRVLLSSSLGITNQDAIQGVISF